MIRPIMKDPMFLSRKSIPATKDDLPIARDLFDTLTANADGCVGMAANMIGVLKRVIIFDNNGIYTVMFNPEIVSCTVEYETEEGCLSLSGIRKTKRWENITVKWQNMLFQTQTTSYSGWTAQIIQHEIDHCNGILI